MCDPVKGSHRQKVVLVITPVCLNLLVKWFGNAKEKQGLYLPERLVCNSVGVALCGRE